MSIGTYYDSPIRPLEESFEKISEDGILGILKQKKNKFESEISG